MVLNKIKDIIGWFDFQEIYDEAVENFSDGDIFLEVGCFMGKSTYYLCEKIKESGKDIKVYVIDIFEAECEHHADLIKGKDLLEIFKENLSKYLDIITIIKGKSQEVFNQLEDNHFSMIFIDAAHEYESVKLDINNFYHKLKQNGIFAGHDYGETTAGVGKAVDEFVEENNLKLEIKTASWYLIKSINNN